MSSQSDNELKESPYRKLNNTCMKVKAKQRLDTISSLKTFKKHVFSHSNSLTLNKRRLLTATQTNNTEMVQKLLEDGEDPNTSDHQGRSVLHLAVSKDFPDIVRLLLQHGANTNVQDIIGNTPLHLAACTGNLKIITMLLNDGADVSCLDTMGRNPLQLAESKLQILRKSWRSGTIEMMQLRAQLQQIVDIMISLWKCKNNSLMRCHRKNVEELKRLKFTSEDSNEIDDQMTKLLSELQGFKIM